MEKKILIFTATYNEADNIKKYLDAIHKLDKSLDILIIDDNSPDKTWGVIEEYSKNKILLKGTKNDKKDVQ